MLNSAAEQYLILIHHPDKLRLLVSAQIANTGLVGTLLLDLAHNKNIEIEDKKIKVISGKTDLSEAHQLILEQFEVSRRQRKVKNWISKLYQKSRKYKKLILNDLEKKNIIKIHHKNFLGIKYSKTRLVNTHIREQLILELRDAIFSNKKMDNQNYTILGLIEACKLHKIICTNRKEIKTCRTKVREIMKSDAISHGVDIVIKEMQAAIMAVIMTTTVAASASN